MEKKDGEMMSYKGGMMANMPSELIMKYYPKDGSYLPEDINDGLSGVDGQMAGDSSEAKKNLSKTKF